MDPKQTFPASPTNSGGFCGGLPPAAAVKKDSVLGRFETSRPKQARRVDPQLRKHKPYEFGVKVRLANTVAPSSGGQFILHAKAPPSNPYDGHTLKTSFPASKQSPAQRFPASSPMQATRATTPRKNTS